jgi:UDP-4-amino-4,6-dideoxy-N-acetyl-beta-L-altrosamine transaminase
MNTIPYGKQNITDEDISEVVKVLKSDFMTQGPLIDKFEKKFSEYIGNKYSVAVSNGTAALHLSVLALNLKKGDKVITSPLTFVASANCIKFCGADVIFSDIDPETFLLDFQKVKNLIESSPKGTYKGIIPVDFAGRAVNLEKFKKLAIDNDLWILEDSCHSPGGFFIDSNNVQQNCGNGNFADLAIFSFHPVKHIACGEGGMITTNNFQLYSKLKTLRTHGITKNKLDFKNAIQLANGNDNEDKPFPNWYMEMQVLGYNYRLTDMQSALGASQLNRAKSGVEKRREIAKKYFNFLNNKDYVIRQSGMIDGHAYHLYVVEFKDRLNLYNFLRQNKVYAQIHYFPCHLMPYYKQFGYKEGDFPQAESYYKNCISLPMFPELTQNDLERIFDLIEEFYKNN